MSRAMCYFVVTNSRARCQISAKISDLDQLLEEGLGHRRILRGEAERVGGIAAQVARALKVRQLFLKPNIHLKNQSFPPDLLNTDLLRPTKKQRMQEFL